MAEKKPKPSGRKMPILDKIKAFTLYCTPDKNGRLPSVAAVAKIMGVSVGSLGQLAVKDGWKKKRDDIAEIAILKTTETLGEKIAKVNEAHYNVYTEMAEMGITILRSEQKAYIAIEEKQGKGETVNYKKDRLFSVGRADVARQMVVEGVKGQRVALGLPTDVTKSMALNLTATSELPLEDLQKMQTFLDINLNKKLLNG